MTALLKFAKNTDGRALNYCGDLLSFNCQWKLSRHYRCEHSQSANYNIFIIKENKGYKERDITTMRQLIFLGQYNEE